MFIISIGMPSSIQGQKSHDSCKIFKSIDESRNINGVDFGSCLSSYLTCFAEALRSSPLLMLSSFSKTFGEDAPSQNHVV